MSSLIPAWLEREGEAMLSKSQKKPFSFPLFSLSPSLFSDVGKEVRSVTEPPQKLGVCLFRID
jgi:hypothetical protein